MAQVCGPPVDLVTSLINFDEDRDAEPNPDATTSVYIHDDNDGNNGAAADDDDVDDVDDIGDDNLPLRVGKRNDGCDETKTKEEEMVGDTHNNQPDHREGGGRWRRLRRQRQ